MDVPNQIKLLTDRVAPRYKHNPFGSSISRFVDPRAKGQQNDVTEDEIRVRELISDLEKHTGINKTTRPGIRTGKLAHQNTIAQYSI